MQERKTHSKILKVGNKRLDSSEAYLGCQGHCLLNQEICITCYNKITSTKNNLLSEMSFTEYVHVVTKLSVLNDKNISKILKNHGKKLHNLYLDNFFIPLLHLTIQIR